MAVPNRPAAGGVVESAWGQVVHDEVVAWDIQAGRVNVSISNTTQGTAVVVFPRPFAAPPTIVAMVVESNSGPGLGYHVQTPGGGTTPTQSSLRVCGGGTATVTLPVDWIAYGPRS